MKQILLGHLSDPRVSMLAAATIAKMFPVLLLTIAGTSLSPHDIGVLSIEIINGALLGVILAFGGNVLVRKAYIISVENGRNVSDHVLLLPFLVSVPLLPFFFAASYFLGIRVFVSLLLGVGIGFYALYISVARGGKKFDILVKSDVQRTIVCLIILAALKFSGTNSSLLYAALLFLYYFYPIIYVSPDFSIRRAVYFFRNSKVIRELSSVVVSSLLSSSSIYLIRYFLGINFGLSEVGFYGLAFSIAAVVGFVFDVVISVYAQDISQKASEGNVGRVYRYALISFTASIALSAAPVLSAYMYFPHSAYASRGEGGVELVAILCSGFSVRAAYQVLECALVVKCNLRHLLYASSLSTAISLLALYVFVYLLKMSSIGAAFSFILCMLSVLFAYFISLRFSSDA